MTTPEEIKELIQQTRQYEFADGLRDLQYAVLFATLGGTSWFVLDFKFIPLLTNLMRNIGPSASWLMLLIVFLPGLLGAALLGFINLIRRRWLWRESGMVMPSPISVPRLAAMFAVIIYIASLVVAVQFTHRALILQMLIVASGWSTGILLIGLAINTGLRRYHWIGGLGILASCVPLFLPFSFGQTALWFGLAWAVLFFIPGITALLRFRFENGK
jgi:hypothetical protein